MIFFTWKYCDERVCRICQQESRAVAGNYRAMRDTCTESLNLILGQRSECQQHKHGEVVEKPPYVCEGLTHVVAWYHGTSGPKFTKFWE